MSDSVSAELGTAIDRDAIEKVTVKLISNNVKATSAREFWALVSEEAGSTYDITLGGNACERIYSDIRSKNKKLPNEKAYVKRMLDQATAQEQRELEEREASNKHAIYPSLDKIYDNEDDRERQQKAGASLALLVEREAAQAKAEAEAKTGSAKGKGSQLTLGKGKGKQKD